MGRKTETIAENRYRLLLEQLEADGLSQEQVAHMLAIRQGSVSRIKSGARGVGIDAVESAVLRLKINPAFFFWKFPKEPNYKDFRSPHKLLPRTGYAGMFKFFEWAESTGLELTDQERAAIERQEWDGEPTEQTYLLFLQALRSVKRADTNVRKVRSLSKATHQ